MLTLRDVLFGLVMPGLVAVVLFFLAKRSTAPLALRKWLGDAAGASGAALGIGFILAAFGIQGAPQLPPAEAAQWLPLAAAAMLVVAALELASVCSEAGFWSGAIRFVLIGGLFALTIAAVCRPLAQNTWTAFEATLWIAGLWIGEVVLWAGLTRHANRSAGLCSIWALGAILAMGSVVLVMSGSQIYGQLAAALPVVWGPLVLLATITRTRIFSAQTVPMLVLLYGGLIICGQLYAEVTAVNAVLLAIAPLGLYVGDIGPIQRWKPWQRGGLQLVASLTPAGIATALAMVKFLHDVTERARNGY